jgi:hypothetical protein
MHRLLGVLLIGLVGFMAWKTYGNKSDPAVTTVEAEVLPMPALPPVLDEKTNVKSLVFQSETPEQLKFLKDKTITQKALLDRNFILEMYQVIKLRKATVDELSNGLNIFEQEGTREAFIRSLLLDSEYAENEEKPEFIRSQNQAVLSNFFEKFFTRKLVIEKNAPLNRWRIKRQLIERSLEVVDAFLRDQRKDDLFIWFALLSADLNKIPAINFQASRKHLDPQIYIKWAQKVPYQHLKGELATKLAIMSNQL